MTDARLYPNLAGLRVRADECRLDAAKLYGRQEQVLLDFGYLFDLLANELEDLTLALQRENNALADKLVLAPQLFHEAYMFGQHHQGTDVPEARRICLELLGSMLDALPTEYRTDLEAEGADVLEQYLKGAFAKDAIG